MAKGNPNPSPETRFKKGQSGNPCGKTPETKAAEMAAAEIAAKMRHAALIRMQEKVNAGELDILEAIDANTLKLFKDSEDRAHGTPKATSEVIAELTHRTEADMSDDELAAIASAGRN